MTKKRMRRAVKNWLPQEGRRIEVRHPVTGRKVGVSDHQGFVIIMVLVIAMLVIAFLLLG
jgi:hypothetical protein